MQEVEDRLRRIGSPQVGGEDLNSDVELPLDLTPGRLEGVALAGHEHEIESTASKNFRYLDSDSAGAASDEGGLALGAVSICAHDLKLAVPCYTWITWVSIDADWLIRTLQVASLLSYSRVAQVVEQVTVNHRVGGSSPSSGAVLRTRTAT